MSQEYLYKESELFEKGVSELIRIKKNTRPFYSQKALNYFGQRHKDEGAQINDESFVMLQGDRYVAVFLGFRIHHKNNYKEIAANENPAIVLIDEKNISRKNEKKFVEKVYEIFTKEKCDVWYRDSNNDGSINELTKKLLQSNKKFTCTYSKILYLENEYYLLRKKYRKSYSSLINWGYRELEIDVLTSKNIKYEHIIAFRKLHIREAGRETRSLKSWEKQLIMIEADEAFIVQGKYKNELVSASLFTMNKNYCYYQVSASRRDLFDKPLNHALIDRAIKHAKDIQCKFIDFGDLNNISNEKILTEKERNISGFKDGFGGAIKLSLEYKGIV